MSNQEDQTLDNAADLLDETIDDLADAPENKPFPNGAHRVNVKISRATDDKKRVKPGVFIISLAYLEQLELVDPETPEEDLSKPEDTFGIWIHTIKKDGTPNKYGQGDFKKIIKPIATALGTSTVSETLEAMGKDGVEAVIVSKVKKSKDPQYSDSMVIDKIELV